MKKQPFPFRVQRREKRDDVSKTGMPLFRARSQLTLEGDGRPVMLTTLRAPTFASAVQAGFSRMKGIHERLLSRLRAAGQQHLLAFWDELDQPARDRLARQIEDTDFELISRLVGGQDESPNWSELAARAKPPRAIRRSDQSTAISCREATARGDEVLCKGKVGMILVAGGQGTRLGFPHPKGMYPLGPISRRTLFQIHIDRLIAVGRRYGVPIPLYLMTSPATHAETVEFLQRHDRFGLPTEDLVIFCQGMMPAVDAGTHEVLLADRDSLFLSPDGHGGMLAALGRSGGLADARRRGIELLFYGQVDNPLLQICDPRLIGYHALSQSEMTTQVVQKRDPLDRVGNVVEIDGRAQIIEYSDLPEEIARRRNPDGSLCLWAGSIAVHLFAVDFLERAARRADVLPFHRAMKKAPYLGADGQRVEPRSPNAVKFERFIFDLLPSARNPIVVEAAAEDAFAPVKNASGSPNETPETAQAAMIRRDTGLLRAAGAKVEEGVPVEINPRWALGVEQIARRIVPGLSITEATYFR
jgi:UDP-N-acetylglucosamine/UDP-N-acetylgalactosamine diphosphorylase